MLHSRGIWRSITPHHFSKAANFELYYWEQRGIVILAYQFFNKYRLTDSNKITAWSRRTLSVPDPLCRPWEHPAQKAGEHSELLPFSRPPWGEVREMMSHNYCSQQPQWPSWQLTWKMQFLSVIFFGAAHAWGQDLASRCSGQSCETRWLTQSVLNSPSSGNSVWVLGEPQEIQPLSAGDTQHTVFTLLPTIGNVTWWIGISFQMPIPSYCH